MSHPVEKDARCACGTLALATTVSERHDRRLHGTNFCITSVSISPETAALARLCEAHAPEPYEFETDQTYCPASDGPSDQCDVCIVLACITPPAECQHDPRYSRSECALCGDQVSWCDKCNVDLCGCVTPPGQGAP